jgi:hypothetical protein
MVTALLLRVTVLMPRRKKITRSGCVIVRRILTGAIDESKRRILERVNILDA